MAVGTIGAKSIGGPGTQLTMRTFHTGGVASRDVIDNEIRAFQAGTIAFVERGFAVKVKAYAGFAARVVRGDVRDGNRIAVGELFGHVVVAQIKRGHDVRPTHHHQLWVADVVRHPIGEKESERAKGLSPQVFSTLIRPHRVPHRAS